MTVIIPVLCVLITIGVIELLSLNNLRRISYRYEVNMNLTEPGEATTLTYRVYNTSRWPVMFVSFSFLFNDDIEICGLETNTGIIASAVFARTANPSATVSIRQNCIASGDSELGEEALNVMASMGIRIL